MKNYTITVNGNVYEVSVEESGAESAPVAAAPKAAAPKAAAPKKAAAPAAAGSVTIAAPMIGKILKVVANTGASVKKKEDTHKMAEANKAFAHFRW